MEKLEALEREEEKLEAEGFYQSDDEEIVSRVLRQIDLASRADVSIRLLSLSDRIGRGGDQGRCQADCREEGSAQEAVPEQEHAQEPTRLAPKDPARLAQAIHHRNEADRTRPQAFGEEGREARGQGEGGLRGLQGSERCRRAGWYGCGRGGGWTFCRY